MRFIRDNMMPMLAVMCLLVAAASWLGTPEPVPPATLAAPDASWALPKLPDNQSAKSAEAVNSRNLWGVVAANAPPPPPAWTVKGIVRSGTERYVLVTTEGKPGSSLKVGDALPDGTKIVQIDADRFYVLTPEKKKIDFGIYKNDTAK